MQFLLLFSALLTGLMGVNSGTQRADASQLESGFAVALEAVDATAADISVSPRAATTVFGQFYGADRASATSWAATVKALAPDLLTLFAQRRE